MGPLAKSCKKCSVSAGTSTNQNWFVYRNGAVSNSAELAGEIITLSFAFFLQSGLKIS